MAFALPDPGGADSVSERDAQAIEASWIGLVVARQVGRLGPQRPVVRSQVECVQHVILENVHAARVYRQLRGIVLAEISIFEDGRRPRSAVRQLIDLNWFLDDDAVGAQPGARS